MHRKALPAARQAPIHRKLAAYLRKKPGHAFGIPWAPPLFVETRPPLGASILGGYQASTEVAQASHWGEIRPTLLNHPWEPAHQNRTEPPSRVVQHGVGRRGAVVRVLSRCDRGGT